MHNIAYYPYANLCARAILLRWGVGMRGGVFALPSVIDVGWLRIYAIMIMQLFD
jgi:hypothetical protein